MDQYLILIYILFALAAVDLIVGVSNDAVNFLNSAIGSKAAPFKTILIIASVGILFGASFSSGMMEVARKGIFNPGFFTFETIMFVFLAVMITDIILLDLYNTLGLPTSTTVSIVFELLGAAFTIGLLASMNSGGAIEISEFINFSSALKIISGIFLSVAIAFTIGALIQYVTRLAFTYDFEKYLKKFGVVFSGLAITAITYFLVIKGAKGSTFKDDVAWILEDTWMVLGVSFVFWTLVTFIVTRVSSINPLKVIVLLGTFSLAMAFAGNDLVNFIGVAIAGKQSYTLFMESGGTTEIAQSLQMTFLGEKQKTETVLLLGAGVIMVITLWLSSKAKKVTETEVGLSRQDDGDEKFQPNLISRGLVGIGIGFSKAFAAVLPATTKEKIEKRFDKSVKPQLAEKDQPAFDLLRASVNLMVASILISYATSLKMPLSTTYVSFMVAMGSSLADRAWGRDSAVYRVAGVVNVIGGWLMTALIAFLGASLLAAIIFFGGFPAIIILSLLAVAALVRSYLVFKKKAKEDAEAQEAFAPPVNIENLIDESKINTATNLNHFRKSIDLSIKSLLKDDKDTVRKAFDQLEKLQKKNNKLEAKIIRYVKKMDPKHVLEGRLYIKVFDFTQDLGRSAEVIAKVCSNHVVNHHATPTAAFLTILEECNLQVCDYLKGVHEAIDSLTFTNYEALQGQKERIQLFLNQRLDEQVHSIQKEELSGKNAMLQVRILLQFNQMLDDAEKVLMEYVSYAQHDAVKEAVV